MKTVTKTIATLILGVFLFASTAFGGCGDMNNGSKCVVDSPTTTTTTVKKISFDFDKEIVSFFRNIFTKMFG